MKKVASNGNKNQEFIICLTGDHTTPVEVGDHSFEPVPVSISIASEVLDCLEGKKKEFWGDCVEKYDEVSACEGVLGRFSGN